MAERDYLGAALPDRITLLGQSLRPFALGHLLLLLRSENCFARKPAQPPTLEEICNDLVLGVFVCCQTYEEAAESIQAPDLVQTLRSWLELLGPFDVLEKAAGFRKYIADGSTMPEMSEPDSDNVRFPGAPFIQRVRIIMQAKLGNSPSDTLNKPWGEAIHDYFAYWEIEDKARILNEEEKAIVEDADGSMAALDQFLQTQEFQRFLERQVAAEPGERPQALN